MNYFKTQLLYLYIPQKTGALFLCNNKISKLLTAAADNDKIKYYDYNAVVGDVVVFLEETNTDINNYDVDNDHNDDDSVYSNVIVEVNKKIDQTTNSHPVNQPVSKPTNKFYNNRARMAQFFHLLLPQQQ